MSQGSAQTLSQCRSQVFLLAASALSDHASHSGPKTRKSSRTDTKAYSALFKALDSAKQQVVAVPNIRIGVRAFNIGKVAAWGVIQSSLTTENMVSFSRLERLLFDGILSMGMLALKERLSEKAASLETEAVHCFEESPSKSIGTLFEYYHKPAWGCLAHSL
ncbi:hypothetical protein BU17DRAFT_61704 [Hysterangium stoloniferum]|nr:hypothetical protein BU17DRAFT_61704 [Hysterangium stoloniferum]